MPRTTSTTSNGNGPAVLDKSLPALPPHVVQPVVFQQEGDTMDTYETPQSPASNKRDTSYANIKRGPSPSTVDAQKGQLSMSLDANT